MPRKEEHRIQRNKTQARTSQVFFLHLASLLLASCNNPSCITSFRLILRQRVSSSLRGEGWSLVALPTPPAVFHVRNLPPAQVQSVPGFQQLHERLVKSMTPLVYRKSLKPSHSKGRCSDILWMNSLEGVEVEVSSTQRPLVARKFSSSTSGLLTYSTYPEDETDA